MVAAACRKKGAVNTPSEIQFFENGSGGFDLSQNRRLAVFGPQKTICHYCGFFYSAGQHSNLFITSISNSLVFVHSQRLQTIVVFFFANNFSDQ